MKKIGKVFLRLAMCISLFLIFGEPAEDATFFQVAIAKCMAILIVVLDYKINYQYAEKIQSSQNQAR